MNDNEKKINIKSEGNLIKPEIGHWKGPPLSKLKQKNEPYSVEKEIIGELGNLSEGIHIGFATSLKFTPASYKAFRELLSDTLWDMSLEEKKEAASRAVGIRAHISEVGVPVARVGIWLGNHWKGNFTQDTSLESPESKVLMSHIRFITNNA